MTTTSKPLLTIQNDLGYAITVPAGKGRSVTFLIGETKLEPALYNRAKVHPVAAAAIQEKKLWVVVDGGAAGEGAPPGAEG